MIFERQQYQQDCVDNIVAALEGIDLCRIDGGRLSRNVRRLAAMDGALAIHPNRETPRLDVLMETGTGKTFTYLQTIFELRKRHGHRKFIIVLPRTAIKQGVLQNIRLTDEYFYDLYREHVRFIDYPRDGLAKIRHEFINSGDLSVLITTNHAFNSEKNNINKKDECLFHFGSTWKGIAGQKPVVIIDEPHLLKGSQTSKGLDRLGECLRIRFGATYPTEKSHALSNVVYVLDSISAFNQYLVKRIRVSTVYTQAEQSGLSVVKVTAQPPRSCEVVYSVNRQPHRAVIKTGDDLGARTTLAAYRGRSVTKILTGRVCLDDASVLPVRSGVYDLSDEEIRGMIRSAIRCHFEKEESLFAQGIKALSLFFIPSINSFRGGKGARPRIKGYFEEEYRDIWREFYGRAQNADYRAYLERDFDDEGSLRVHEGYFAGDRGKSKEEKEAAGVEIILNQKERLLSFGTPLRFVFSVWALQEGWDNPNVFTICKLASTSKETSRRQQVGRGLRVAVNQHGKRVTYGHLREREEDFFAINALDMIVSEQEHDFIYGIQNEVREDSFSIVGARISHNILVSKGLNNQEANGIIHTLDKEGVISFDEAADDYAINTPILPFLTANRGLFDFLSDERFAVAERMFAANTSQHIVDANRPAKEVTIRPNKWREFKRLWETINKKATIVYKEIVAEELIKRISAEFNEQSIPRAETREVTQVYDARIDSVGMVRERPSPYPEGARYFARSGWDEFAKQYARDARLPLAFVVRLFNKVSREHFVNNPQVAQEVLARLTKEHIHRSILRSVDYRFSETAIYANALQDENGRLRQSIRRSLLGAFGGGEAPKEEFLYDTVVYDSDIERGSIVDDPMQNNADKVTVFAKLPKINIPTPYKTYNPDFAYLVERGGGKTLFLIVETKGYKYAQDIPEPERQKIAYAKKFFCALRQELSDVDIRYTTRISGQGLLAVLREVSDD